MAAFGYRCPPLVTMSRTDISHGNRQERAFGPVDGFSRTKLRRQFRSDGHAAFVAVVTPSGRCRWSPPSVKDLQVVPIPGRCRSAVHLSAVPIRLVTIGYIGKYIEPAFCGQPFKKGSEFSSGPNSLQHVQHMLHFIPRIE